MQTLNSKFEIKGDVETDGTFEGYASVFEQVDSGMDVMAVGAFHKSLEIRKPKMLWQHQVDKPIGVWEVVKEDERGLFVKGRLLDDVQAGREAMSLLRAGAIDSMSIGYRTKQASQEADGRVRRLMEVELHEISLVTFPMLTSAVMTSVKGDITTERQFEQFLRDAGYSKKEATAIALHGFKAIDQRREADDGEQKLAELNDLHSQIQKLKEQFQ